MYRNANVADYKMVQKDCLLNWFQGYGDIVCLDKRELEVSKKKKRDLGKELNAEKREWIHSLIKMNLYRSQTSDCSV